MGISVKGMNISMTIMTIRISNKKRKARTAITENSPPNLIKLLEEFKDYTYLGYSKKQIKMVPTEVYFFPFSQLLKNNNQVLLRNEIIRG